MSKNTNGSGNGKAKDENIVHFPTLANRDRMRREQLEKEAQEAKAKKAYIKIQRGANDAPMFNFGNITPFAKFMALAFIAVHLVIFLLLSYPQRMDAFYMLGFVPGYFTGVVSPTPWFAPIGVITHMFVHGSWMHLAFNGVMGLALSVLFERNFGTRTTAIFFFACGIIGAAFYMAFAPYSTTPVIGASGCISGLFAAAIMFLHERGQMGRFSGKLSQYGPWPILGFWLAFMLIAGFVSGEKMAWQAHIGGFVGGAVLYYLLRTKRIKF